MTYTNTWDETAPLGSALTSTVDDVIRQLKLDIRERLAASSANFNLGILSNTVWYTPHGLNICNGTDGSAGDLTNDITVAVGDCNSNDVTPASRVQMIVATAITKQLDAAWAVGTSKGMLATGAAVADGTYHIFVIHRPDTGVTDVAADTSVTGANIAANTDAAYTKKRRIASIVRASSTNVKIVNDGNRFWLDVPVLSVSGTPASTAAILRTLDIPTGVQFVAMMQVSIGGNDPGATILITDPAQADTIPSASMWTVYQPAAGAHYGTSYFEARTNTSAQVRSRIFTDDLTDTSFSIFTLGWFDERSS